MGLHTGEVVREADDFFGKNVILAARIAATARGGEILVSALLKELTDSAGDIPFGPERGVALRGLAGTRPVHEVLWSGDATPERREHAPAPAEPTPAGFVFRCEGDYWTLAFEGNVCRLRDAKGLHHIAYLLRHPGEQFEARVLAAESDGGATPARARLESDGPAVTTAGLGDAGEVLDAKAKAAYRRQLEELREELAEAEDFNDTGRASRLREEMEFLTSQLASAVGLGGRDRKAASNVERARLTVTKRIKDALAKVRESHPALGDHLAARIKTGYLCGYTPEPSRPIAWEL
jgi:non-specific serine/threonine protein kinase